MVIENSCHEISIAAGPGLVGAQSDVWAGGRGGVCSGAYYSDGLGIGRERCEREGRRLLRHPLELRPLPACLPATRMLG